MSTIDTTSRTYPKDKRPRAIIKGWEAHETTITRINSTTAYFRAPYIVGELAIEVEEVLHVFEPVTIYAAVIEWPSNIAHDPDLILARSMKERAAQVTAALRSMADALTYPQWRDALNAASPDAEWPDLLDALDQTPHGGPFITTHEKEIPA